MSAKGISHPHVTWPAAGTTSKAVALAGQTICGLYLPSGFAGTAVSFTACDTPDGTYVAVKDDTGTAISYTVSASSFCRIRPSDLAGIQFLKVVSGSSEAAGTAAKLAVREVD
ncbi:MAG: hypothetical protein K2X87_25460 [Gemmataceae bacterium]|nr:hypothetical protein [Gemmataceae bacterium]